MEGGLGSAAWADLAEGCAEVLIVAPIGEAAEGPLALMYRELLSEVDGLRNAGTAVNIIEPDAAALAAFGPNLMDPTRCAAGAQAGLRQGLAIAGVLRHHWAALVPRDH